MSTNNTKQSYSYDDFGRLTSQTDEIGNEKLEQTYSYTGNQLASTSYKKQFGLLLKTLNYGYDSYGYLTSMTLNNGTVIWKLDSENGRGQVEKETLGNGVVQTYGYTTTGAPSWRKAAKQSALVQHFGYTFEEPKGQLTVRKDMLNQREESFTYDGANRLEKYTDNTFKQISYDNKGSITSKPDAGQLIYNVTGKPYAIGELSANLGSVPPRNQHVSYSSFERPLSIDENNHHASFSYNASGQRMHMALSHNNLIELSRYYLGDYYELEVAANGKQTERLYLGGSAYNAPAVWVKQGTQEQMLYIHRDHLGNITQLTDEYGAKVAEYGYDAWGRMRNPQTLEPYGPHAQPELLLSRGYTGHEHLPWFGLVNMNARLYDPVLGRFLSPDPYVSSPDFSQDFNRYIYGLNNPLSYVDPDGKHPILIVIGVSLAVAYLQGVKANNWEWNPGKWDWKNTTVIVGIKTDGSSVSAYVGAGIGNNPLINGIEVDNKGNVNMVTGEVGSTQSIALGIKHSDAKQIQQSGSSFGEFYQGFTDGADDFRDYLYSTLNSFIDGDIVPMLQLISLPIGGQKLDSSSPSGSDSGTTYDLGYKAGGITAGFLVFRGKKYALKRGMKLLQGLVACMGHLYIEKEPIIILLMLIIIPEKNVEDYGNEWTTAN